MVLCPSPKAADLLELQAGRAFQAIRCTKVPTKKGAPNQGAFCL